MRRLLILNLLMAAVTSALMLAAVSVGCAQPDRPDWLHLRDCSLPCWAGMTPGLTPIDDVKHRLSALMIESRRTWVPSSPLDARNPFFTWSSLDRLTGISINLFAENDGKTASLIGLGSDHRDALMPRLGDAILAFGPPTCVIVASDLSLFNLIYEDRAAGTVSEIDTDSLRWLSPIRSFSTETEGALMTCGKLRGNRWRGLYPARQYLID
jgi:hypothetical protein